MSDFRAGMLKGLSRSNERPAEELSAPLNFTPQQSGDTLAEKGFGDQSTYSSRKLVTWIFDVTF